MKYIKRLKRPDINYLLPRIANLELIDVIADVNNTYNVTYS